MPNCAVSTCKNTNKTTKGTDIRYFGFPKNSDMAKKWAVACYRADSINLKNATICSEHFEQNAFEMTLKHRLMQYTPRNFRSLKCDAVPTINIPNIKKENSEEIADGLMIKNRKLRKFEVVYVNSILDQSSTESVASASGTQCLGTSRNNIKQEATEESTLKNANQDTRISQQEVNQLRERIKLLEHQNGELLKKLENEKNEKKKYERALAYVYHETYKKNKKC